jgi:hypothetical protein
LFFRAAVLLSKQTAAEAAYFSPPTNRLCACCNRYNGGTAFRKLSMSTIDPQLVAAYKSAVYRVRDGDCWIEFFVDSNSPELENILRSYSAETAAFITAYNPRSHALGAKENQQFHENLLNTVAAMQLQWIEGEGGDRAGRWEPEQSALILGIDRASATKLALDYGQNAWVWIQRGQPPKLILTR